jgi:hypothetical protein
MCAATCTRETIHARGAATHRKGCNIDTPKSGKGLTVVVPPHIRDDLKAHLEHYVDKATKPDCFRLHAEGVTSTIG